MKLKEAFRAQNCLTNKYNAVCSLIAGSTFENVVKTHKISQAGLGEDYDEKIQPKNMTEKGKYSFDKLVDLALAISQEKKDLVIAIENAKAKMDVSFDAIKQSNETKHDLIYRLEQLSGQKTTEAAGYDEYYGKDNEGKQAIYRYPTKTLKSYDVDKTHLRAILKRLRNECEEVSLKLDQLLVSTDVYFESRFDYDSTIEEIYLDF